VSSSSNRPTARVPRPSTIRTIAVSPMQGESMGTVRRFPELSAPGLKDCLATGRERG